MKPAPPAQLAYDPDRQGADVGWVIASRGMDGLFASGLVI
jgi:hypothetical protein